jgi:hypothetical protein
MPKTFTTSSGNTYRVDDEFNTVVLPDGDTYLEFDDILELAREYVKWNRVDTTEVIQALGFTDDD